MDEGRERGTSQYSGVCAW